MRIGRTSFIALSLLASGAAFAGAPGWSVSETSGQVSVVSTGLVKVATRGGPIAIGDVINTGRNGRAVLVRGEEYLVVSPNSRISVADPVKSGSLTQIVEQFGNVIYKIKKMTMPHFAVETPFLAAVVKGTTFSVTVTDKGASVQVLEGRVEVTTRDGGASYLALPGDIGSVSATAPGRLNVQGRKNLSIDSLTPATAAAAVTASLDASDGVTVHGFDGVIETAVSEGPVQLDTLTNGTVRGDSTLLAMIATTPQSANIARTASSVVAGQATNVAKQPVVGPVVTELPPAPLPIAVVTETPRTPLPPVTVAEALPAPLPPVVAPPPIAVAAPPAVLPPVVVVVALPSVLPPVVVATPPVTVPKNPVVTNPGNGSKGNGKGNNGNGNGNGGNNGGKNNGIGNGNDDDDGGGDDD